VWLDEISRGQYVQVKRERRTRQPKTAGDCPSGEAVRRVPDKQAKDVKPVLLRECGERIDSV
jgi:hypothetical protein